MTAVDNKYLFMPTSKSLIPSERIEESILLVRDQRVLLDVDLAKLYGVETKVLNQAVKRNLNRFPKTFMFQLTDSEYDEVLRSQIVTLKGGRGQHRKYLPYVFTEHGAVMLTNILKSPRAVEISILIVEAFIRMRQMLASQKGLMQKILAMEKKYDKQFKAVFDAIRYLMKEEEKPKRQIGFND